MALKVCKPIVKSDVVSLWRRLRQDQEAPMAIQPQWSTLGYKVMAMHISNATPGGAD